MYKSAMLLLVVISTALSACAGTRGPTVGGDALTHEVGPAIPPAVEREALPILERFGYTVVRTDRLSDRISMETQWVQRSPDEEEKAAGVVQARSRIIISTRPRGTTNSAGSHISGVTVRYELQHQVTGSGQWVAPVRTSAEVTALVRRIVDALKLELQVKGLQG